MELTYKEVYHMNPVQARKRIVQIYQQTQNYCETARRCHTSPQLVRKWVKRYQQYGEQGLHDLPKTPKRQPRKTDPDIEQRVLQRHQKTHYGRQRLARHLAQQGIHLSPHTIRHILKRHATAPTRPRKPCRRFYPAHWAWESQEPFTLIQADVKDIYDKARSAPNAGITCASIASPAISGLSLKVARGCACWRSAVRFLRGTGWRF